MRQVELRMYGDVRGEETLSWEWVAERLEAAPIYWLTTTQPDGMPHSRPIHGVYVDGRLLLSNGSWRHNHNWEANPRVSVHLPSGTEVVIVEGRGAYEREPAAITRFLEAYNPKYGYSYDASHMPYAFEVVPDAVFAWTSLGEKGESGFGRVGKWVAGG